MPQCVVLYLYILYMGFCENGYHPFSKWMILFRGLNCPSRISFAEISGRGIVRVISGALYCALQKRVKTLEEQFKPTVQLLLSNEPRACVCSQRTDKTFAVKFGWDGRTIQIKLHGYLMGRWLWVRKIRKQNMLKLEWDLDYGVEIKGNTKSEDENWWMIEKTLKSAWWVHLADIWPTFIC